LVIAEESETVLLLMVVLVLDREEPAEEPV
jgi:hypothetical protein